MSALFWCDSDGVGFATLEGDTMHRLNIKQRRLAMAIAAGAAAVFAGFAMQTSNAAVVAVGEPVTEASDSLTPMSFPQDHAVPSLGGAHRQPSPQSFVTASTHLPVGALPTEALSPAFGCGVELRATPVAAALVTLSLSAPCHASERVLLTHETLSFHADVASDGRAEWLVPALAEKAVFTAVFDDGARAETSSYVDALGLYDRVVLQWHGEASPELHAREFGADYGEKGHVWRDAPRSLGALAAGAGGFLIALGTSDGPNAAKAEIYTVPAHVLTSDSNVQISIEAEVTEATCGQTMQLSSLSLTKGHTTAQHSMEMQLPDCSAEGEFLLLKNLSQNLTIAQK